MQGEDSSRMAEYVVIGAVGGPAETMMGEMMAGTK